MPGVFLNVRRATYLHFASHTLDGTYHGATLRGMGQGLAPTRARSSQWGAGFVFRSSVESAAAV